MKLKGTHDSNPATREHKGTDPFMGLASVMEREIDGRWFGTPYFIGGDLARDEILTPVKVFI